MKVRWFVGRTFNEVFFANVKTFEEIEPGHYFGFGRSYRVSTNIGENLKASGAGSPFYKLGDQKTNTHYIVEEASEAFLQWYALKRLKGEL